MSGTSFSAPHVAGQISQLIHTSAALEFAPEALKAIVMASALHTPISGDTLDEGAVWEKMGVGGIDVYAAGSVIGANKWSQQTIFQNSFGGDGCKYFDYSANSGQKVRAAIVWTARTNYPAYGSQPGTDLDLKVYAPNGTEVASSGTYDNTYEVVSFTAPSTGTYHLCAKKFRMDDYSTYLGVAWLNPASSVCGAGC